MKFFEDTQGWPGGGVLQAKKSTFILIFFFQRQRRALQLVYNKNEKI